MEYINLGMFKSIVNRLEQNLQTSNIGQTTTIALLAIDYAINNPDSTIMIVSRDYYDQSLTFNLVNNMINQIFPDYGKVYSSRSRGVVITNGSVIKFIYLSTLASGKGYRISRIYNDSGLSSKHWTNKLIASIIPCIIPNGRLYG